MSEEKINYSDGIRCRVTRIVLDFYRLKPFFRSSFHDETIVVQGTTLTSFTRPLNNNLFNYGSNFHSSFFLRLPAAYAPYILFRDDMPSFLEWLFHSYVILFREL